ncbi:MAG: thioesterase family protein [Vicinamibacteria bacterium]
MQFHETDAAGLVHFSVFFRYMEEAEHALWRAAGLSIAERGSGIGWPRLETSFEFRQPLRFEDEFEIAIRVVELASRTMRYQCRLTKDGALVATGRLTIVCVRKAAGEPLRAIAIPAEIAARFQAVAEDDDGGRGERAAGT